MKIESYVNTVHHATRKIYVSIMLATEKVITRTGLQDKMQQELHCHVNES